MSSGDCYAGFRTDHRHFQLEILEEGALGRRRPQRHSVPKCEETIQVPRLEEFQAGGRRQRGQIRVMWWSAPQLILSSWIFECLLALRQKPLWRPC